MRIASIIVLFISVQLAPAQPRLVPVNDETTVSNISFEGNQSFDDRRLDGEIVTKDPSWLSPILFWQDRDYNFRPVELQKDVRRLERFYHRHGFPEVAVDYSTTVDSIKNKLDISFLIEEGAPLILQSVDFIGPDGRQAAHSLLPDQRNSWSDARKRNTTWRIGHRPTIPELFRVETEMTTWLRNHGYAFGSIEVAINVDSTARLVDVEFKVDPGPLTRIGNINVEWLDNRPLFGDNVVLRQLPLEAGDPYSLEKLTRGQRRLFNLSVFRVALIDMPDQDPDSLVNVRVRLQRGKLNVLRAQTGYGLEEGLELRGEYIRRNFLGQARRLTLSGILNTEIGERLSADVARSTRRRLSISMLQPHFLITPLSALGTLFYDRVVDRTVQEEELGGDLDFVYEFTAYRTWSSRIAITRVRSLMPDPGESSDPFVRGIIATNAVFGSTDDFLVPSEGFLIRPLVEIGTPLLFSEVEYVKAGLGGTLYRPIGRNSRLALRLFRGRLWPTAGVTDDEAIAAARFDRARFYAGGADDVRGWAPQLLGPKQAVVVEEDTLWQPRGSLQKWLANAEYRFPLPFTPAEIEWAVFADGARLGDDSFRVGTGIGVRYRTQVGYLRFDLAFKVNPSPEDLRDARDVIREGGIQNVPPDEWQRLRVHFGIGHAF